MSKSMAYSCLNSNRQPSYKKMLLLKEYGIPLEAWADIKSFISGNDTKLDNCGQEIPNVNECDGGNSNG
ncbi:MAG: hypothetical protein LBL65_04625 [Campylobacteraceae bacterium]|jgi:hypothetical protein|nr:hypothetical protein [Campylobacteraceae bacterium]